MSHKPPATILLVNENETKRDSVARILRKADYRVREVGTGVEALRMVAEMPDLVILGGTPPDLCCVELCRRIKADPGTANIPVLHVSTTFVDMEEEFHSLEGCADGYLTDVLEPVELIATVKALLRARDAEEAARLSLRQRQVTFDAINDGVILLDASGKVLQVNRAFSRLLGTIRDEPIGQTFHGFLEIAPNPAESPFLRMQESRGREFVELMRADRRLRLVVDPIQGQDGVIQGALCIVSDITDGHRLGEELRSRPDESAVARKDEFLAMLAHELRNPLAPILNSLEVIRLIGPAEPGVEQALTIAGRQVRHMARLLDNLLDVSRLTRGKIQLHLSPVNLAEVVEHAVETALPGVLSGGQNLDLRIPPGPIPLNGDSMRLEQVVGNLLNNAVKYSERGGKIELEVTIQHRHALIRVKDEGIGLGPEMIPRVFDLFSQAELSLDRVQEGLGIGLTLVKRLVEMHGGTVTVTSPGPGLGSEFLVRLPLSEAPASSDGRPEESPDSAAVENEYRVLVVDDHLDSATSLSEMLKLCGHQVSTAHDGPEAIELSDTHGFDVVLLDLGLPGMDGYEVAEQLRISSVRGSPKIVALTGYSRNEDFRRSREFGFDAHLVKPVDFDALRDILEQLHGSSAGVDL